MARKIPTANKARALAFVDFCDRHGIKPYVLLANAAKQKYSHPPSQREIRDYLASDEATEHVRVALRKWKSRYSEQEVEEFFRQAWPVTYSFIFPGKSQLPKLGSLGDFQVLVSGRQSKVVGWTKEKVGKHVAAALKSLPEEERDKYFPFLSFRGSERDYDSFRDLIAWTPPLPVADNIHSRKKDCLFPDIYQLNKQVATSLRVPYEIPTAESIVAAVVGALEERGTSLKDFRVEDIGDLIEDGVIPQRIFRKEHGIFDDWHDLAKAVRTSDGVDRLPLNVPGYLLSREKIQERLKKRWPRIVDGVPQPPPHLSDLREISGERLLPSHFNYIGPSYQFTSLFDLHRAIEYPQITLPVRFPHSNIVRTPEHEAFDLIDDVVREMYAIGMKPQNEICFTPQDFFEAKRLGIVTTPSYIVGRGQWYLHQSDFDAVYVDPYSPSLVGLREGRELTLGEQDALGDRAMEAIETCVATHGMAGKELVDSHIHEWSRDGLCPRLRDVDELFGGLHAVNVYFGMQSRAAREV